MPANLDVIVVGLPQLQAKLNKLENVGRSIGPHLRAGGYDIRSWTRTYPPASNANVPSGTPPERWYQRGKGTMYASVKGTVRSDNKSQQLNRRWSVTSRQSTTMSEVTISNSATYARYVHDERGQASFHKRRGWRTVQDAIKLYLPKIVRRIEQALNAEIAR